MTFKNWGVARGLAGAASILALAVAAPAWAQDAETDDGADDLIIVTGSRIATDSALTAASPVLSIGGEDIKASGELDISALLRESPALQGSLPASFSAFNGTALGASQLNLRNLGTVRTLVVEDGRRHVAGIEGTGNVDINTISTALLGGVEILTGGASSIYGADAVTGVVNFKIRDGASFDGLEVRAQAGISDDNDAEDYFISVANGFSTDDGKGSIVFAVEYQGSEPIFAGDRDFTGSGRFFQAPNGPASGIDPQFSNVYIPALTLPISSDFGIIAISPFESAFVESAFFADSNGCRTVGDAFGLPAGTAGESISTCQVFDNGVLRAYNPGDPYLDGFNASGGDGVPAEPDDELLLADSDRVLFQGATDYAVNEYVSFFADAKYVFTRTTESNQVNGFNDDIPISLDNPFIPTELAAQIATLQTAGLSPSIVVSRDVLDLSTRSNPIAERKTFRIVGGVTGELPVTGFDYEVSFNYGRTDADITSRARIEDRYFAGIDAVVDPSSGEIVCRSELSTTDPTTYVPPSSSFPAQNDNFGISTFVPGDGQCVPINIFGRNSISDEAAAFAFLPTTSKNEIEQRVFLATLSGDTEQYFSLPGGPIGFALGFENRKEESSFTADGLTQAGLTFGTIDSNGGPVSSSFGEYEVSEGFYEVKVPLLADLPLINYLEFSYSARYSNYTTFGTNDTWSYGARYAPFESLTLRGTVSRAVRVPNIGEAFAPQFTVTLGADQDPCNLSFINGGSEFRIANCQALVGAGATGDPGTHTYDSTLFVSARIPGTSGGNPDLSPEVADTVTFGGVWQPDGEFGGLFDGLTVLADYYEIEIDGLIGSLAGFDIAQNCVDAPTINNAFCAAVPRDPTTGVITTFTSGTINLSSVRTTGVDWRVTYDFDVPALFGAADLGEMRLSANGTRFLSNDETRDASAPDDVTDVLTTLSRPKWIVNFAADWLIGDFALGWNGRYESSQLLSGIEPQDLVSDPFFANVTETGGSIVNDFTAQYFLSEKLEIYGGVRNAFEVEPYLGALSRPTGPRGRFFFLGVNATF